MLVKKSTLELLSIHELRIAEPTITWPSMLSDESLAGSDYAILRYDDMPFVPGYHYELDKVIQRGPLFVQTYALVKDLPVYMSESDIRGALNVKAGELGYDSMDSAVSYAGYDNEYKAEAIKLGQWRSAVWSWWFKQTDVIDLSEMPKYPLSSE